MLEFKDRNVQYPGRVKLRNVVTNEETTYDIVLSEGTIYDAGTSLNKETFEILKEEILDAAAKMDAVVIEKGDKGDKGDIGPKGDKGEQGEAGRRGLYVVAYEGVNYYIDSVLYRLYEKTNVVNADTLKEGDVVLDPTGSVFKYIGEATDQNKEYYVCESQSLFSLKGENGSDGENGSSFVVVGSVANGSNLPLPEETPIGTAYFVGTVVPRDIYVLLQKDGRLQWENEGTLQGPRGAVGATPEITVSAMINDSTGTPYVEVVKAGTNEKPDFVFKFKNLKGETGPAVDTGKFVTTDTAQTISGAKTFTADITASNVQMTDVGENTSPQYVCSFKDNNVKNGLTFTRISDSISSSSFSSTSKNLVTERDCYFAMPTINGTKASTGSIYAPASAGSITQYLKSSGSGAPSWLTPFVFSGYNTAYSASSTVYLSYLSVGQIGCDVRMCTNRDTKLTINLPSSGRYNYFYAINNPYYTTKDTTRTSVGYGNSVSGGTTVCTAYGSATHTTILVGYYRIS